MSSPVHDRPSEKYTTNTATEDPFISPEFHLRNRSLSSTSQLSGASSAAPCCSNASTVRRRRYLWHWRPFPFYFRVLRLRAIPTRWLCVLLCLIATFLVWRWPPPSTRDFAFHLEEKFSTSALQVLQPRGSAGSRSTDPEQWLSENSEEGASTNKRWWKRSSPKPRAAIITLVRNEELKGILQSMRQLEHHWNRKYQYPWVFFNEKPFNDEFKVVRGPPIPRFVCLLIPHTGCYFESHLCSNLLRVNPSRALVNARMGRRRSLYE